MDPTKLRAENVRLRRLLRAAFYDMEQVALYSHMTWTGSRWIFDDRVWRRGNSADFRLARRLRDALGIEPLNFSMVESPRDRSRKALAALMAA